VILGLPTSSAMDKFGVELNKAHVNWLTSFNRKIIPYCLSIFPTSKKDPWIPQ
jgi:hypothetical protein